MPNIIAQNDNSSYVQEDDRGTYVTGTYSAIVTRNFRITRGGNSRVTRAGNIRQTRDVEVQRFTTGIYIQEPA